jgi:uncharacterized protein YndB with AHSA1/START domain
MSTTRRAASCRPEDVFAVLADGWLYAQWVVGAARMRAVDEGWPAPGTRLHHSVGPWPLLIDDTTSSVEYDPPARLVLQARAWPAGEASVAIHVEPTAQGCVISLFEDASRGPAKLIPPVLRRPMLDWRNTETLRRLSLLAEGGARSRTV